MGLTLLEVLVACLILGVTALAWARLEGHVAHAERVSAVRRELASWMRDELRVQRAVRSASCLARVAPPGWTCSVDRRCVPGGAACDAELVQVAIAAPDGATLVATTAVWWPLELAPVEGSP